MWITTAAEVGAEIKELSPLLLEIRRGAAVTRVLGQTVTLNDSVSVAVADDKELSYELLTAARLPTPEYLAFNAAHRYEAVAFAAQEPLPCVIKPVRGNGGDGVTGAIVDESDVRRAVLVASRYSERLLIERHVAGTVYRLLVLDGEIIDVLRRRSPHVVGDGRSTIGRLIHAEFNRRLAGNSGELKPLIADLDCVLTLKQAGLSLRTVLGHAQAVAIKSVTNFNRAAENETVHDSIGQPLREEVTRAAETIGLRLAGVDVITSDLSEGLKHARGVILDINGVPGLHHHYLVADRAGATHVAAPVLLASLASGRLVSSSSDWPDRSAVR